MAGESRPATRRARLNPLVMSRTVRVDPLLVVIVREVWRATAPGAPGRPPPAA